MSSQQILRHLGGRPTHLNLLALFYENKDNTIPLRHVEIFKFVNAKSTADATQYTRKMVNLGLIEQKKSEINQQNLGYKITYTGIKFFELYKKIGENLD